MTPLDLSTQLRSTEGLSDYTLLVEVSRLFGNLHHVGGRAGTGRASQGVNVARLASRVGASRSSLLRWLARGESFQFPNPAFRLLFRLLAS